MLDLVPSRVEGLREEAVVIHEGDADQWYAQVCGSPKVVAG